MRAASIERGNHLARDAALADRHSKSPCEDAWIMQTRVAKHMMRQVTGACPVIMWSAGTDDKCALRHEPRNRIRYESDD